MAVVFPPNPTPGETVIDPATGAIWLWNGVAWVPQGQGAGGFLPLAGGTLTGPLSVNPTAGAGQPAQLTVGGQGINYGVLGAVGQNIAFAFSANQPYMYVNGTAWGPLVTLNVATTTFLQLTGGTVTGTLSVGNGVNVTGGNLNVSAAAFVGNGLSITGGNLSVNPGFATFQGPISAFSGITSYGGGTIANGQLNVQGVAGDWASTIYSIAGQGQTWQMGYFTGASNPQNFLWTVNNTTVGQIDGFGGWHNLSGSWSALSDPRVKTNVQDYTCGLGAITQLQPITFEYNGKGGTPNDASASPVPVRYGLDADATQSIMPELIGTTTAKLNASDPTPTQILTVNTGPLVFALINAMKQITSRLAALETAVSITPPEADTA